MTILFAKTRHKYDSYTDFWRLVAAAEFATCYVDEIDPLDGRTYIFTPMNGEVLHRLGSWERRASRIIWWNLERPADETLPGSLDILTGKIDAIWVSDRSFAKLDGRFSYVPIAGHPRFGTRSSEKIFDVCHLAYLWGRRQDAIHALSARGISVAPEAWGREQQDIAVAKSRLMLNMHQYDGMSIVAPLRFAVAASYGIPIVSETFADTISEDLTVITASLGYLVESGISVLLQLPTDVLAECGEGLFRRQCIETDFRREVERAVAAW